MTQTIYSDGLRSYLHMFPMVDMMTQLPKIFPMSSAYGLTCSAHPFHSPVLTEVHVMNTFDVCIFKCFSGIVQLEGSEAARLVLSGKLRRQNAAICICAVHISSVWSPISCVGVDSSLRSVGFGIRRDVNEIVTAKRGGLLLPFEPQACGELGSFLHPLHDVSFRRNRGLCMPVVLSYERLGGGACKSPPAVIHAWTSRKASHVSRRRGPAQAER